MRGPERLSYMLHEGMETMSKWIEVDGYKNLPVGNWLVQLDEPHFHNVLAVVHVHPNITVIGGYFGFDTEGKVIAYRELPEEFNANS
ncbi:hypothetical protein LCGC14_1371070 [marine sediment metagenome]|uniref:Uncharacterized protein n=1 Tax=marine sediment metagenome TaxID=412755 RepID=A0A0F9K5H9_9ZZZZ